MHVLELCIIRTVPILTSWSQWSKVSLSNSDPFLCSFLGEQARGVALLSMLTSCRHNPSQISQSIQDSDGSLSFESRRVQAIEDEIPRLWSGFSQDKTANRTTKSFENVTGDYEARSRTTCVNLGHYGVVLGSHHEVYFVDGPNLVLSWGWLPVELPGEGDRGSSAKYCHTPKPKIDGLPSSEYLRR